MYFSDRSLRTCRKPSSLERLPTREAAQLARLTPDRLGCSSSEARKRRQEILESHLAILGSQIRLRNRINELLGEIASQEVSTNKMFSVIALADELLEVDPQDSRHLL